MVRRFFGGDEGSKQSLALVWAREKRDDLLWVAKILYWYG